MDFGLIATAIVTVVARFMPFLLGFVQAGANKLAEQAGDAAWQKATGLWDKVKTHFGNDPLVQSAATLVADEPENEAFQKKLAIELGKHLQENPKLAEELLDLLGGESAARQSIKARESWLRDIKQQMDRASGTQEISAEHSTLINVEQSMKDSREHIKK